jgi:hypothetical protein
MCFVRSAAGGALRLSTGLTRFGRRSARELRPPDSRFRENATGTVFPDFPRVGRACLRIVLRDAADGILEEPSKTL